jgi:signal transduction histidine kinase
LQAFSQRLLRLRDEEQARLARELHDTMAQTLVGLRFEIGWLVKHRHSTASPKVDECVAAVHRGLQDLSTATQHLMTTLRPLVLETDELPVVITNFLQHCTARTPLAYTVEAPPEGCTLASARATAVFRIVQEAVTNVLQHAAAQRRWVRMWHTPSAFVFTVRDDGKGILPEQVAAPTSLGVVSIRERAAAWEGTVTIEGHPGEGTTVTVQLPC